MGKHIESSQAIPAFPKSPSVLRETGPYLYQRLAFIVIKVRQGQKSGEEKPPASADRGLIYILNSEAKRDSAHSSRTGRRVTENFRVSSWVTII